MFHRLYFYFAVRRCFYKADRKTGVSDVDKQEKVQLNTTACVQEYFSSEAEKLPKTSDEWNSKISPLLELFSFNRK